jgi:hypothetical protein
MRLPHSDLHPLFCPVPRPVPPLQTVSTDHYICCHLIYLNITQYYITVLKESIQM